MEDLEKHHRDRVGVHPGSFAKRLFIHTTEREARSGCQHEYSLQLLNFEWPDEVRYESACIAR